jgi:leader peptidase (prepilin peptidase) / N-methyltransferase
VVQRRCSYRRIQCSYPLIAICHQFNEGRLFSQIADTCSRLTIHRQVFLLSIRHAPLPLTLSTLLACGTVNSVIPFFFFLFGIVVGSFLNVCISRIPEEMSIISPGSRCPRCESPIKPYDNIPILGWLLLRGKCRNCHLPISPMYPLVEFLTGALFVLTYYEFAISLPTLKFLAFGCLLIILIVTDIRVRLLPDRVNWFGFALGLAFATRIPPDGVADIWLHDRRLPSMVTGLLDALLGATFGSLLLWGAAMLYKLVRKRDGMGMGDVKMMIMVGAFLGLRGTFLTILLGTLLGSVVGIGLVSLLYLFGWRRNLAERAHRRGLGSLSALRWILAAQYQLPLGSFLGIAALMVVYALPWLNLPMLPNYTGFRP